MFRKIKSALSKKKALDARLLADADPKKAMSMLQMLSEGGDQEAMLDLASSYHFGSVCSSSNKIPVNVAQAAFWYEKLKSKKNTIAFENLWALYLEAGEDARAVKALKSAADFGIANSMRFLGLCYLSGDLSLPQNASEGLEWLRKAAKTGDHYSQFELANLYRDGRFVARDAVRAYMWYIIAANKEKSLAYSQYRKAVWDFNEPVESRYFDVMKPREADRGRAEVARDEFAAYLNKEETLQAQRMAERCVAANFEGFE